ncbi:MAG TPA: hypothetical protein VGJ09_08725, partial [Bryobacteraceae bacterium]
LQKPGKTPPKLVFTSIQMAFGDQDKDVRLAFDRLDRALGSVKASSAGSLLMNVYSLNASKNATLPSYGGQVSRHLVEGLPSLDATLAVELVAVGP